MSKKNRRNKTRNQSTNNDVFNSVITPEEAELIERVINGEEEKKVDKKEKKSKSLLEQIGKENMGEIPGYQKPEKLAGNQGVMSLEEKVAEFKSLVKGILAQLNKHGLSVADADQIIQIFEEGDSESEVISSLLKLVNFDKFDGDVAGTVMDIRDTIVTFITTSPVSDEKGAVSLVEILKTTTKDNYAEVLAELGIDMSAIAQEQAEEKKAEAPKTEEQAEEKKTEEPKTEEQAEEKKAEAPKTEEQAEEKKTEEPKTEEQAEEKKTEEPKADSRRFVHEFKESEKLPENVRIRNAAWYVVNGFSTDKYLSDLKRLKTA